jgi:hypothetical protein
MTRIATIPSHWILSALLKTTTPALPSLARAWYHYSLTLVNFIPNLLHDGPVPMEHITPLHFSTLPLENSPSILVAYQSPLSHPRPSRLPFCSPCHKKHPQPTLRTTALLETGQLAGPPEPKPRGNRLFNPSPSTLRRRLRKDQPRDGGLAFDSPVVNLQ